jgi:hypothetical protein
LERAGKPEKVEQEANRKERAAKRKQKLQKSEMTVSLAAQKPDRVVEQKVRKPASKAVKCDLVVRASAAVKSLDDAIRGNDQHKELREQWQVLTAALRQGKLPRYCRESPTEVDPTTSATP